jgi:hypothetical protein
MGCECPDDIPLSQGNCNYLIYSGGPIERLYRLVAHVISKDAELVHGHPVVHNDGSLEFPGEPPTLSGYRRDDSRLYPIWPSCAMRMLKAQIEGGALTIMGICCSPRGDHFSLEISLDQCLKCLTRQF